MEYYLTKGKGKNEGLLGQVRKIKARNSSEDEQHKIQQELVDKMILK